jgi:hypothetical protein
MLGYYVSLHWLLVQVCIVCCVYVYGVCVFVCCVFVLYVSACVLHGVCI